MTDDRSLERAARSWLEEGPTRAPDRTVEHALTRIQTTSQERDLRIPWRYQHMNNSLRLALGTAAVVVAVVVGVTLLPGLTGPDTGASPSPISNPTATPEPSPIVLFREGPLAAGTYITSAIFPVAVEVTVPDGWGALQLASTVTVLEAEEAYLGFWIVQDARRDPCGLGGVGDAPVGPTAADLAAALADAPGFDAPDPVQVTVGGLDAQYVELVGPLAACTESEPEPELWLTADGSCRCMESHVERNRLWIIDLDGTRLVVDVLDGGVTGTSEAALAELQDIIESLQISS
jgi:hypothetical protein